MSATLYARFVSSRVERGLARNIMNTVFLARRCRNMDNNARELVLIERSKRGRVCLIDSLSSQCTHNLHADTPSTWTDNRPQAAPAQRKHRETFCCFTLSHFVSSPLFQLKKVYTSQSYQVYLPLLSPARVVF